MPTTADTDSPTGVLDAVREVHSEITDLEIRKLQLAVEWAVMHPVESIIHAAMVDGTEDELTIAGPGAPLVAEFCVAELALALGMSTGAGKRYLGDAIETRYRLPRLAPTRSAPLTVRLADGLPEPRGSRRWPSAELRVDLRAWGFSRS